MNCTNLIVLFNRTFCRFSGISCKCIYAYNYYTDKIAMSDKNQLNFDS